MIHPDADDVSAVVAFSIAGIVGAVGRALVEKSESETEPFMPTRYRIQVVLLRLLRRVALAVVVAPIVGLSARGSGISQDFQYVLVGISGIVADDLLLFLVSAAKELSSGKLDIPGRLANRFLGPKDEEPK